MDNRVTTRPPDPLWDCLIEVFGLHPAVHRGMLNKAVHDLRLLGATAAEVKYRAGVYRAKWPEMTCSPPALVKWWAEMREMPKPAGAEKVRADADKVIEQTAALLDREREHDAQALVRTAADAAWAQSLPEPTRQALSAAVCRRCPWLGPDASRSDLGRSLMREEQEKMGKVGNMSGAGEIGRAP